MPEYGWRELIFETLIIANLQNGHRDKFRCYRRFHNQGWSSDNFENLPDFQSCLMIDLGRETDGNHEFCLGVRFALCIIKALRLARISEHCSGTVTPFVLQSL